MSLRLERVEKRYPEFTIRLDLAVEQGELATLLGPSGCGKTTSLRLVAGFLAPDRGRIWIGGEPADREPPHRRRIGIVFQDYALFPNLNVLDNVLFGPQVQGWEPGAARRRARELLELVHLRGYERRRVGTLSGGERQRVALARALAPRPRLLLLDEPLSALDAKLRQSLRLEIQAIQRELAVTTVYVTHDQEEALAISDRIAVMREGRIEQVGSPEQIYRRPRNLFVAGFIGQANLIPAEVAGASAGGLLVDTPLGRFRVSADGLPGGSGRGKGRLVLFFRPEACRLAPRAGNRFRARILRREYLGAQVHLTMEAGGERLAALVPEGAEERDLRPGLSAWFGVEPDRCLLLPASSPGS